MLVSDHSAGVWLRTFIVLALAAVLTAPLVISF